MEVSFIVPVYKGNRYVAKIINSIEECVKTIGIDAEIVLVNDYPQEVLEDVISELCNVFIIVNEYNIGIHGSRINGLKRACGKYIVFLDQDDYIRPNYIKSQLKNIGDADASVCRLINGDKEHYTDSFKIEEVVSKEFMMNKWCSIVTPGQVLIRRTSIPDIWTNNIIRTNGADDYFLWLSMFASGCKFVTNDEILFEHTVTGFNTSSDTNLMIDSENEVIEILRSSNLFNEDEKIALKKLRDSLRRIHIKQLDNLSMAYLVLSTLCSVKASRLRECFGAKIAIYGAADIGRAFYQGLSENEDTQIFFIDRNAEYISTNVPVYKLEDAPNDADTVIIAVNGVINGIKNELSERYSCKIFSISEALQSVLL